MKVISRHRTSCPRIHTFYTVGNDYNFTDPACGDLAYICWPTVAPSSLRLYSSNAIPGWENNFLMTTLKGGRIFQLTLNENGTTLARDPVELFRSENRYRDVAFSPDGLTIYVITRFFRSHAGHQGRRDRSSVESRLSTRVQIWPMTALVGYRSGLQRLSLLEHYNQTGVCILFYLIENGQVIVLQNETKQSQKMEPESLELNHTTDNEYILVVDDEYTIL